MVGHVGEHLPWGWLAFALVTAVLVRYTARQVEAAEAARWEQVLRRRPLRRRKALARAKRSRAARAAQQRRRMVRHLRRRRKFQACGSARAWSSLTIPGPPGPVAPSPGPGPVEVSPPEPPQNGGPKIDVADLPEPRPGPVEIDLRDSALYESEITLESGDRLESGIVGWAPHR